MEYANVQKIYVYEKNLEKMGCLLLPRGYIDVFDHNIQTYSSLKLLGQLKPNFMRRYKKAKIRKRRNQKKIPTPKTEVGKNQTNNQVLIQ